MRSVWYTVGAMICAQERRKSDQLSVIKQVREGVLGGGRTHLLGAMVVLRRCFGKEKKKSTCWIYSGSNGRSCI